MNPFNNTNYSPSIKLADLVEKNAHLLLLLEHFEIDFPLNNKSILQICEEKNIDTNLFFVILNLYNTTDFVPNKPLSFNDIIPIVSFLKKSHHFYSKEMYPNILESIKQMAEVNNYKEMLLVEKFFINYFNEVTDHLNYENEIVFPYVLSLHERITHPNATKRKTQYSVMEYKEHHNDIEEKLTDLKNLLINYLPEKNDQVIRRKLFFKLYKLEYDLTIHSKIEDLLLIPLVGRMEQSLKNEQQ